LKEASWKPWIEWTVQRGLLCGAPATDVAASEALAALDCRPAPSGCTVNGAAQQHASSYLDGKVRWSRSDWRQEAAPALAGSPIFAAAGAGRGGRSPKQAGSPNLKPLQPLSINIIAGAGRGGRSPKQAGSPSYIGSPQKISSSATKEAFIRACVRRADMFLDGNCSSSSSSIGGSFVEKLQQVHVAVNLHSGTRSILCLHEGAGAARAPFGGAGAKRRRDDSRDSHDSVGRSGRQDEAGASRKRFRPRSHDSGVGSPRGRARDIY
jgi:hypothetical protein